MSELGEHASKNQRSKNVTCGGKTEFFCRANTLIFLRDSKMCELRETA